MKWKTLFNTILIIILFSMFSFSYGQLTINKKQRYVDVAALYHPAHFNKTAGLKQHHFIVWEGGKAGVDALFTTFASDSAIHNALITAGAEPGNNLSMDTWNKRKSRKSAEPDKKVTGSKITVKIISGNSIFTPGQVLTDLNNNSYDFRFGGNLALIHEWQSGCVICLQSCPGGKIGNRTYTIRDLVNKIPKFKIKNKLPFSEGDEVRVRFQIQ